MHLSLYHPSSMLFLPDPTCLHLFQSVSYLSLWRPCSKNLAPNAKKHVLGSTKRRTKSTSAEERIYQAHIHSISNAGRERWPISRCFKMLQDASRCSTLKMQAKEIKIRNGLKTQQEAKRHRAFNLQTESTVFMLPWWRKEASAEEAGFWLRCHACPLSETRQTPHDLEEPFSPQKSLHQLIQSEAARQAEEADRTPLSCCHMVPRVVPLFVHVYRENMGKPNVVTVRISIQDPSFSFTADLVRKRCVSRVSFTCGCCFMMLFQHIARSSRCESCGCHRLWKKTLASNCGLDLLRRLRSWVAFSAWVSIRCTGCRILLKRIRRFFKSFFCRRNCSNRTSCFNRASLWPTSHSEPFWAILEDALNLCALRDRGIDAVLNCARDDCEGLRGQSQVAVYLLQDAEEVDVLMKVLYAFFKW